LHSIGSLIFEDPQKANSMVTRLGDFLRLTLEHSEDQIVMLGQELEFLRCYLEIEQVRFQDRLSVCIKIDPLSLSASVPYLILQPIVENAIRHGISPCARPGRIKVEAKRLDDSLWLQVEDNGPGIPAGDKPERTKQGMGLLNVRSRLEQIYGNAYRLDLVNVPEGGLAVTIEMPCEPERLLRVDAMGGSL
jgi:two-component system, LytTR family, sensor kinase